MGMKPGRSKWKNGEDLRRYRIMFRIGGIDRVTDVKVLEIISEEK